MREKKNFWNPDEKIQSIIRNFIIWLLSTWLTENNKQMFKHNAYKEQAFKPENPFAWYMHSLKLKIVSSKYTVIQMLGPKHSACIMKLGIQKKKKLRRVIQLSDYPKYKLCTVTKSTKPMIKTTYFLTKYMTNTLQTLLWK